MKQKKYVVALHQDERDFLKMFTSTSIPSSRQHIAARILLMADNNQKDQPFSNQEIAAILNINPRTVIRTKQHYIQRGLHATIMGTYSTARLPQQALNDQQKASLIELARSPAPLGVQRWTLRLLTESMIQRGYVDQLSHETVRKTLKKMCFSLEET
jgi:transposase